MSEQARPRRRYRPPQPPRRRARHWTDYLPLVSLAVLVVAVAVVVTATLRWLSPAGRPVLVPPFIGMRYDRAQSLADLAHVRLRVIAHRPDFHAGKDVVMGQLPSAGERVREGRIIDMILSDGVPMVKTPNLSNLSLRDAKLALENAHLKLGKVLETQNLDVVAGQVLEQHPDPFTSFAAGSSVDVTVSKGRPQLYAPSFIGFSLDFAKKAARDAHVALGDVTFMPIEPRAKPRGTIVEQDPAPGELLGLKQKISLRVSSGPPLTPSPAASPSEEVLTAQPSPSPSASPLLPSPESQRIMRISVALPKVDVAKPVRVVLEDATGSKTLFEQTTTGGITLSFDLTVVGAGTIETYVGGALVNSTPL